MMDSIQLVVTLGGLGLVAFILWFFFGPRATATARPESGRVQDD